MINIAPYIGRACEYFDAHTNIVIILVTLFFGFGYLKEDFSIYKPMASFFLIYSGLISFSTIFQVHNPDWMCNETIFAIIIASSLIASILPNFITKLFSTYPFRIPLFISANMYLLTKAVEACFYIHEKNYKSEIILIIIVCYVIVYMPFVLSSRRSTEKRTYEERIFAVSAIILGVLLWFYAFPEALHSFVEDAGNRILSLHKIEQSSILTQILNKVEKFTPKQKMNKEAARLVLPFSTMNLACSIIYVMFLIEMIAEDIARDRAKAKNEKAESEVLLEARRAVERSHSDEMRSSSSKGSRTEHSETKAVKVRTGSTERKSSTANHPKKKEGSAEYEKKPVESKGASPKNYNEKEKSEKKRRRSFHSHCLPKDLFQQ
eukprot:MONOS_1388.1-p1 / transcript=MONOS_1388.1 / gene=MONOS_1388 / organism=Monocercomonoides_exilis_PA203 / gene_product=unspecified product / transcript_product=unspecified product / location=Mono_scaffold00024:74511-75855(+) / protein_length=378 / sequence_SO=supercontig / SO=protein_coding / is_pseudo=false